MNNISVLITAYNAVEDIRALLGSIRAQTVAPDEIILVDNSDGDDVFVMVQNRYPEVTVVKQTKNLDFAAGYNTAIKHSTQEYLVIVNQDVVLEPCCIEQLSRVLQKYPACGAVSPVILRMDPAGNKTTVIDSVGVTGTRSRRFDNIGEGEDISARKLMPGSAEVFGFSGAVVMVRRAALEDVAHICNGQDEYIDESFVAYKDDVDLSYRFQHRGWTVRIDHDARAYHKRSVRAEGETARERRKARSLRERGNSYRNHWWTLFKNEPIQNLLLHSPWIAFYELQKLTYILLFERDLLPYVWKMLRNIPQVAGKRRQVLTSSKISATTIRQWFMHA